MPSPVSYRTEGKIGVIRIDAPPVNALSHAVRQGIVETVTAAQSDASEALLLICAGRTFCAGADIREFGQAPLDPWLPDMIAAIEQSNKLVVAALHGTALGGGFETALGAHYRCAVGSAKIGLPEVNLGLLPGAGGTQRTPRIAGVKASLDLATGGKPITASQAHSIGLIDRIVDGDLLTGALDYINELLATDASPRRSSERTIEDVDRSIFDDYRTATAKRARGQIAPGHIIDCIEAATRLPFDEGMAFERERFSICMASPQSAAMRHVFFAERQAGKIDGLDKDTPKREIESVGIIGGGTMGVGIAMSFANAGFPVTLLEVNDAAVKNGLDNIESSYAGSVKKGKLDAEAAAACQNLISGSTDYASLADVDLVVEAVFEDPNLKKEIFRQLDAVCKPGAILATNTSYQDVDAIAAVTERPQDVIGMHFFSPAHIMRLLEVVRGAQTAADVLMTVMALAKRIRKVAVVSGVCYGFIGNRMLRPYMKTAQLLLLEGATPQQVDQAMESWGFAMGPLRVADLAGLDIAYKARQALTLEERGDPKTYTVVDRIVEMGRLGQKTGNGFYRYPDGRKPVPDLEIEALIETVAGEFDVQRRDIGNEEIVERLVGALVEEGRKILDEGIAQRSSDIDVVYIYGYGFPASRGGPMYWAENH